MDQQTAFDALRQKPAPHLAGAEVVEVAVMSTAPGPYHYRVPPSLQRQLSPGARVLVPLGGQPQLEGVVLRVLLQDDAEVANLVQTLPRGLKAVHSLVSGPKVPADLLQLVQFVADYYLAPLGEALRLVLPHSEQARVSEQVRLTDAGRTLATQLGNTLLPPDAALLSRPQIQVLQVLAAARAQSRATSLATLMKQPALAQQPRAELTTAVRQLAERQLLTLTQTVLAGASAPQVTLVQVAQGEPTVQQASFLRRSKTCAALLAHLQQHGPTPLPALRERWPSAKDIVKKLVEAGLCSTQEQSSEQLSEQSAAGLQSSEVAASSDSSSEKSSASAALQASAAIPTLTAEQATALALLRQGLEVSLSSSSPQSSRRSQGYRAFLLHGVTGSGKTELYLRLIDEALRRGRTALVLVPEIALTPQLASRFMARFGRDVAVLHSALTPGQRQDAWRSILNGQVRIALGPRSALFAPLANLGVVIVDEEHDPSFKQQDGVRYHGRDVALMRAAQAGAVAVLGSATPSLESMELVRRGKLALLTLTQRATGVPMPKVEVIDLKKHVFAEDRLLLSMPLREALEQALAAGEQSILFLNRRGYATFLLCQQCGHRLECPHCAVTLTWHKGDDEICCHYCGHTEPVPDTCPLCHQRSIARLGLGTEKLEEQVQLCFPEARVARLDRDTAGLSGLNRVLSAMHRREIDILIGTQMLAKGHDFPGVTLVGVVLADTGMGLPDFRASERTFQLLAQVAGRAGRAGQTGRVLIQTYNPEHPAVACAATHDYLRFAEQELSARLSFGFPPSSRLGLLRIDGVDPYAVRTAAEEVAATVREVIASAGPEVGPITLLGPAEAPLSRLKGRTRWQMLIRAPSSKALRAVLRLALRTKLPSALRLHADVDPVSTL